MTEPIEFYNPHDEEIVVAGDTPIGQAQVGAIPCLAIKPLQMPGGSGADPEFSGVEEKLTFTPLGQALGPQHIIQEGTFSLILHILMVVILCSTMLLFRDGIMPILSLVGMTPD